MYKISKYINQNGSEFVFIHKQNEDGTTTTFAESLENADYNVYLKWLAEGNTPEPADQDE